MTDFSQIYLKGQNEFNFMDERKDIRGMLLSELQADFGERKIEKYRAAQVYSWLYKGAEDFSGMKNIPAVLRERLDTEYFIEKLTVEKKLVSKIDGTTKFLFATRDGEHVESVLMHYEHGDSACISTQVGCKMGCSFCASARLGFARNLTPGEMLSQIDMISRECGCRVSNVVLMGIGEPLDNYDNVIKFLHLVNHEDGLNIGLRHISLSTCGLVDKIDKLSDESLPVTLTISLHAPNDEIRKQTMPIANKWSIKELLDACRRFIDKTGRRISFEYALISGVNDSKEDAHALGKLLSGMLCHVNLIPVNPIKEKNFQRSEKNAIKVFTETVETYKISVTVRRRLGADINASCGQLRAESTSDK